MSKNNGNTIKPREHGSQVVLDPSFLLGHALYMPSGETIVKSHMTLGQAIGAIAFAHIKTKMPRRQVQRGEDRIQGWQIYCEFCG